MVEKRIGVNTQQAFIEAAKENDIILNDFHNWDKFLTCSFLFRRFSIWNRLNHSYFSWREQLFHFVSLH